MLQTSLHDGDHIGPRRVGELVAGHHDSQIRLGQPLPGPSGGTGSGHHDDRRAARRLPGLRIRDRCGQFTAVGRRGDHRGLIGRLGGAIGRFIRIVRGHRADITGKRRDPPDREFGVAHDVPHVLQAPVGGRAEVDRRPAAGRGGHPGGGQEFVAGPHQIRGAGPDPLRIGQHDVGPGANKVGQQLKGIAHQHRDQGLHTLDADPVGQVVQHLGQARVTAAGSRQLSRAAPHLGGQQDLPARRRRHGLDGLE